MCAEREAIPPIFDLGLAVLFELTRRCNLQVFLASALHRYWLLGSLGMNLYEYHFSCRIDWHGAACPSQNM